MPWCGQPATPLRAGHHRLTVRFRCPADHRFSMGRDAVDQLSIDQIDVNEHNRRVLAETTAALRKPR